MTVDTTFLPKTNGLVFGDRMVARANKGRVFLLTGPGDEIVGPPPSMNPIIALINGETYDYQVAPPIESVTGSQFNAVVSSAGQASPSYVWSARSGAATFSDPTSGTTTITINETGSTICTCTLTDHDSLEDSLSIIVVFYSPLNVSSLLFESQPYGFNSSLGVPGPGEISLNAADPTLGNVVYMSTTNSNGEDLTDLMPWADTLTGVLDINGTDGRYLFTIDSSTIVNNGGYWVIPYTRGSDNGVTIPNGDTLNVSWFRT